MKIVEVLKHRILTIERWVRSWAGHFIWYFLVGEVEWSWVFSKFLHFSPVNESSEWKIPMYQKRYSSLNRKAGMESQVEVVR
jgi:hypothetical protein